MNEIIKILLELEKKLKAEQDRLPEKAIQADIAIQCVRGAILKLIGDRLKEEKA